MINVSYRLRGRRACNKTTIADVVQEFTNPTPAELYVRISEVLNYCDDVSLLKHTAKGDVMYDRHALELAVERRYGR